MNQEIAGFPPDSLPEAPKTRKLHDFSLNPSENTSKHDVSTMTQSELLALHAEVEARITGMRLSEVNLEKETLIQFQRAKALQEDANKTGSDVPMNQRAQVQNSLANLLTTLAKMQMELHDSETIKRWKAALVRVVKELPKEQQAKFFELIELEATTVEQELVE